MSIGNIVVYFKRYIKLCKTLERIVISEHYPNQVKVTRRAYWQRTFWHIHFCRFIILHLIFLLWFLFKLTLRFYFYSYYIKFIDFENSFCV